MKEERKEESTRVVMDKESKERVKREKFERRRENGLKQRDEV